MDFVNRFNPYLLPVLLFQNPIYFIKFAVSLYPQHSYIKSNIKSDSVKAVSLNDQPIDDLRFKCCKCRLAL